MKDAMKKGVGFGIASGVITTLGLIVGLTSGTGSRGIVLSGILLIAIADALSDSLGIHISEESDKKKSHEQIWTSTIFTFISKFLVALSFVIPILLLPLGKAITVSIIWGLFLISVFSWYISRKKGLKSLKIVVEHLALAIVVIIITHLVGKWVGGLVI